MGRMGSIKLHGQLSLSGSRLSSSPGTRSVSWAYMEDLKPIISPLNPLFMYFHVALGHGSGMYSWVVPMTFCKHLFRAQYIHYTPYPCPYAFHVSPPSPSSIFPQYQNTTLMHILILAYRPGLWHVCSS